MSAIIIDEAPSLNKMVYEAIDRSLKDLRNSKKIMGGVPTLLCGDFRQCLPIIPKGSKSNCISSSIKYSKLWTNVKTYKLTKNMRVFLSNDNNVAFPDFLLKIGNGTFPIYKSPYMIKLPDLI